MATASQLLLKFKQDFPDAGTKFESYGAITRDQFLTEAVNNAAAAGVSIEYGGYVNNGPQTSINTIFMPYPSYQTLTAIDAMTWFLFETRNAMRAKEYCAIYKRIATETTFAQDSFAWLIAKHEALGGIEVGEMWQKILNKYASTAEGKRIHTPPVGSRSKYFYDLYLAAPNWKANNYDNAQLTKTIKDILISKHSTGQYKGQTRSFSYGQKYQDFRKDVESMNFYRRTNCTGPDLDRASFRVSSVTSVGFA
jgi:hypothetical protein